MDPEDTRSNHVTSPHPSHHDCEVHVSVLDLRYYDVPEVFMEVRTTPGTFAF